MAKIDFEKIRMDAIQDVTGRLPDDTYGKSLRMAADVASQVTKKMLIEYHTACMLPQDD